MAIAVITNLTFSSLLMTFVRQCAWLLCGIWYIYPGFWRKLIVRWHHSTPPLLRCNVAVICQLQFDRFQTTICEALNHPLKYHRDSSEYVFIDYSTNMVNTRWKQVKCYLSKKKLIDKDRLEALYQQYHPISMNGGLLTDGILPPAGWDWPEPSWCDFTPYTWMAIIELVN